MRIWPATFTTTPLPRPLVGGLASGAGVASVLVSVSIRTSDGWIVLNTSSQRGGPGVCDASTLSTVSTTWRCVMPGLAGNSAT